MASRSPSSSPDSATGSGTDPTRPDTGEPLCGSDSDSGPGEEGCGAGDWGRHQEGTVLEAEFEAAAERLGGLIQSASREQLLYLYARYKQAKVGKCNTTKPGFFDFEGKQKWEAWKQLGDMTVIQAMQEYVASVKILDPEWNPKLSDKKGKEQKVGFGGPVVSSLYQEEMIREEDKNIFDYCRENNIEHVTSAIHSKTVDVNLKDEEGRALLHWACDRGHKDLVSVLLQNKANINSQSKNQPHRRGEYNVYSTFQSHEPEFDYLKSLEIEEKINKIRWLPQQNAAYFLLSTNVGVSQYWCTIDIDLL
ncbi:Acyl-CoA-binding domain-containing protein 6 [Acipenser ruthenus]|uniref:Acyl-CoA-binding domain-containing protein 6 n=1 Tax=Acipenser ruthenus TaxID=7906 RepID=A0A444U930_ACIRT|nr:Acyl-CoA-binding domain-containing protein 6 [Acipenser ruthenus]